MLANNLRCLLVAAPLVAVMSPTSSAVTIRTNDGNGADAEVRESQGSADLSGFVTGTNRGNSTELSTRLATNRSSVGYAKFDISGLPASSDPFWASHPTAAFDIFVRQSGGNFSQMTGMNAAGGSADLSFNVLALDPNGTYSDSRTDRSGNNYTASFNSYDWAEGDGSAGTGIDFYDAPGIVPHCKQQGSCAGADAADFMSTLGVYDDFDSNVISLGEITPIAQYPGASELDAGNPLTYEGSNLRDLVLSALDAGRDTVTIMFHHKGPQADTVQAALGRNYNLTPKEHLMLDAGNGTFLDNSNGAFSPALRIIPEPASAVLVAFSCLFGLFVRRRR